MFIKPLKGIIVVKPIDDEEVTTISGIIIANTSSERMTVCLGEVIALGEKNIIDDKEVEFQVNLGDRVYFNEIRCNEMTYKGEKYYLIDDEKKIFGVVC